jgi:hypothetical protein
MQHDTNEQDQDEYHTVEYSAPIMKLKPITDRQPSYDQQECDMHKNINTP